MDDLANSNNFDDLSGVGEKKKKKNTKKSVRKKKMVRKKKKNLHYLMINL
jgi:hypothetical protein